MDIQSLIDDIDGILLIAASRPLWFKPGDPARERQVLERVRSYLVSQQQNVASRYAQGVPPSASGDALQQIMQSVRQEMSVLRADLLQPLQTDIKVLHQQRESLLQEIRQLERSKQDLDLSAQPKLVQQQFISEFSQELVSRCTASLTQQFAQIREDLEMRWAQAIVATEPTGLVSTRGSQEPRAIAPQERLEQLRQLQAESDRLLSTLDVNQRLIFETLQNDLKSYQESLSQGLAKMHNLGAQGETLFTALINRLAQQLGREASTLLQSSLPASEAIPKASLLSQVEPASLGNEALKLNQQDDAKTGLALPSNQHFAKASDGTAAAASPSTEFQALTEDNFADHLNSEEWEVIEGLDSDSSNIDQSDQERNADCIDTFLQLDLETSNPSAPQDLDYLLGLINEPSTPSPLSRQGELTGVEALNQAAELNIISDQRRQEIDDLYKSLFGSDSLMSTSTPQELDAAESAESATPPQEAQILPEIDLESRADAEAANLREVDDLLFEGLVDPAIQSTQGQAEDWSARQSTESWDLFVENSATDLLGDNIAQVNHPHSETPVEQETLTTITALTDLFEEMGINQPLLLKTEIPSVDNQAETPIAQAAAPETANLVEDRYIPASPEEDLLVTDTLDSDPDREIRLDQKALRQLSDDLYSFEEGTSGNLSRPDAPDANVGDSAALRQAERFLMSDELLAEDWEEFVFPSWPNDDLTTNLPETNSEKPADSDEAIQDHATAAPSLSEELDFEPDLFPSEALELDHESWDGQIPEEYIGFEDEIVIDEMEWDEPNDGIMEEVIASPLEFGEAAKQNALQLGQQDESNPDSIIINEQSNPDLVTPIDSVVDEQPNPNLVTPIDSVVDEQPNLNSMPVEDQQNPDSIIVPTTESEPLNVPPTTSDKLASVADEITLDLELETSQNLDSENSSRPTTAQELPERDGEKLSTETGSDHPESSANNNRDLDLAQPDAINSQTDQETLPDPAAETKHNNHDFNG
jgi:hypothetical protein